MRKTILLLSLALLALGRPKTAAGQDDRKIEPGGVYNQCVEQFYDSEMYNWLSFRNGCDVRVSILVCRKTGAEKCFSTLEISPGRKSSIGESRDEVAQNGDVIIYVCQDGFLPVDANNHLIERGKQRFRCRES